MHQLDAVRPGQEQVQQHKVGPVRLDEAGHVLRVAGHERVVARVLEYPPNVAQCLRVVIHHQDMRPLFPGAPRAGGPPHRARRDADPGRPAW